MATEHGSSPDPDIKQQDLRRVLERAIQLDAGRAATIRVSEVQRIGEEIGISGESIARAASEFAANETRRATSSRTLKQRLRAWAISAGLAGAAFLVGVLVGRKVEVLSFWLFVGTAVAAFSYRRHGKDQDYIRDMAALSAGFGAGWFLASGMIDEGDTLFHVVMPGVFGIVTGWTLVHAKQLLWKLNYLVFGGSSPGERGPTGSHPIKPDVSP